MARRRGRPKHAWGGAGFWNNLGPGNALAPPTPAAKPPPGYYDPALDAALGTAQRGYGDLQADYGRDFGEGYGGGRVGHDYLLGLENLDTGHRRAGEDLATQRHGVETSYTRGAQDYRRNVAGLQRDYRRLAGRQAQGARVGGVMSGGLAARAASIRAGNQAWDRNPLDTGFARLGQDRATAVAGIHTAGVREGQDWATDRGALGLQYQRAGEDARLGLERAGREQSHFGLDTNAARVFSATQLGWNPETPSAGGSAPAAPRGRSRRRTRHGRQPNTRQGSGRI